jgi:hypothetical protein
VLPSISLTAVIDTFHVHLQLSPRASHPPSSRALNFGLRLR